MSSLVRALVGAAVLVATTCSACGPGPEPVAPATASPHVKDPLAPLYDFEEMSIIGEKIPLSSYRGKALLIVNVASKCGYTPQYEGLEKLFATHEEEGLMILGFPSDQFGHQEPGSEKEIKTFCSSLYGVRFQMFSKIAVNGPDANPLYKYLRAQQPGSFTKSAPGAAKLYEALEKEMPELLGTDAIKWNFTKFLVDRRGHVIKRYEPYDTPESIEPDIVKALADK